MKTTNRLKIFLSSRKKGIIVILSFWTLLNLYLLLTCSSPFKDVSVTGNYGNENFFYCFDCPEENKIKEAYDISEFIILVIIPWMAYWAFLFLNGRQIVKNSSTQNSIQQLEALDKLNDLRNKGALTDSEFDNLKAKILEK